MSRNFELLRRAEIQESAEVRRLPAASGLATTRYRPPATTELAESATAAEWLRLWKILRKRWTVSAAFAAVVIVGTMLVTLVSRPVYEPTSEFEIIPPGTELFSLEGRGGSPNDAEYLETQAKTVKSDELAIDVIRQQRLDREPDIMARGTLSTVAAPLLSLLQRSRWGGAGAAGSGSANELRLTPAESRALVAFQDRLTVKRDTSSRLVDVSFSAHDPALAARVTNAVVTTLIERTYQTRHEAIMRSTEWLSRQLDDIRERMDSSNRRLAEFQSQAGITGLDENRSTFTEEMAELSRQKTQAQAERIQLESYLGKLDRSGMESLPQAQSSGVIQQLTQRLADARVELAQTLAVNGKNHPNSKKLQNQIDELQAQLTLQRRALVAQLKTSYQAARSRELMIDREIKGTDRSLSQMARYTALKKEADANVALYNALYARVKEAGISAASKSSNIRIVDKARVLDMPTSPRPVLNLAVAVLVALVGSVLLALVREALDTRIHTVADVRRWTGVSTISILPFGSPEPGRTALRKWGSGWLTAGPAQTGAALPKFMKDQPGSIQAEAVRSLHTSIMLSQPGEPPQVLLVVSSLPNEGKSTVAINLALALAQQGPTCLLDADLRRPMLAQVFGVKAKIGLGDHLSDSVPLESILFPVGEAPQLTIVPAGTSSPDPGQLISSAKMRTTLETLRQSYAFLVIDSPPLLPYADGRALSPFVDGVILVGRAGVVTRDAMLHSMELLRAVNSAPVLEVVLNAAEQDRHGYESYYKSYK